jgi:hypothetical protein
VGGADRVRARIRQSPAFISSLLPTTVALIGIGALIIDVVSIWLAGSFLFVGTRNPVGIALDHVR